MIKRAALYIRVSTEEQAREGYSLDAQKENLVAFAKAKGYKVVDIYADEGISARKQCSKRKAFQRLIEDVKADKIDIILFIKLDRWFRNVADYYKAQEILDKHNVQWTTTLENYDTTTANGRLHVNIRLAVAQDESDRTSERIKFVFANRVSDGKVISGNQCIGYKIENKEIVYDMEEYDFVKKTFETFIKLRTIRATAKEMNKYRQKPLSYKVYHLMLRKNLEKYVGTYRNNKNYYPPYIDMDTYKLIKEITNFKVDTRRTPNTFYIFSQLLYCAECGGNMLGGGYYYSLNGQKRIRYACKTSRWKLGSCPNNSSPLQHLIEKQLLERIQDELKQYKVTCNVKEKLDNQLKVYQDSASAIKRKIARLKELYINELISLDEYKSDLSKYQDELDNINRTIENENKPSIDLKVVDMVLSNNFIDIYNNLTPQDKSELWHSIIDKIYIYKTKLKEIKFK